MYSTPPFYSKTLQNRLLIKFLVLRAAENKKAEHASKKKRLSLQFSAQLQA
jgi:hypothetical protein